MDNIVIFHTQIHSIDIVVYTFIALAAIQVWTLIGYIILQFLDEYETQESNLLICFFWFVMVVYIAQLKLTGDQDDTERDKKNS